MDNENYTSAGVLVIPPNWEVAACCHSPKLGRAHDCGIFRQASLTPPLGLPMRAGCVSANPLHHCSWLTPGYNSIFTGRADASPSSPVPIARATTHPGMDPHAVRLNLASSSPNTKPCSTIPACDFALRQTILAEAQRSRAQAATKRWRSTASGSPAQRHAALCSTTPRGARRIFLGSRTEAALPGKR